MTKLLASVLLNGATVTLRFAMAAVVSAFLLASMVVKSATAEEVTAAESCPTYRVHLRSARVYLERGDRAGALRELRGAQEALESCIREDAEEISLAAWRLWTPTG